MVTTCTVRLVLIQSMSEATVVDLPLPVMPLTSSSPSWTLASRSMTGRGNVQLFEGGNLLGQIADRAVRHARLDERGNAGIGQPDLPVAEAALLLRLKGVPGGVRRQLADQLFDLPLA